MLDDLRELYQEVILDHGRNPRNFRRPEQYDKIAEGYNPLCGDRLILFLSLDDQGLIKEATFQGKGCAISVASASMMTEILQGKSPDEAEALFRSFHRMCTEDDFDLHDAAAVDEDAFEHLAVLAGVKQFPIRVKCATLAWHTMQAALDDETEATTE